MVASSGFRIQGSNIVQTYTNDQYSAPIASVMEYIKERLGTGSVIKSTPPLPIGCRAYFKDAQYERYLVEVAPGIHPFNYSFYEEEEGADAMSGNIQAVMPWQYFLFNFVKAPANNYNVEYNFESVKLFWANHRFIGWDSRVYVALLPNLSSDGTVCLGDAFPQSDRSVCDRIESVVNEFYDHTFNNDLGRNTPYEDIDTWEVESKRSRLIYRDWPVSENRFRDYINVNPETLASTEDINLHTLLAEAIQRGGNASW